MGMNRAPRKVGGMPIMWRMKLVGMGMPLEPALDARVEGQGWLDHRRVHREVEGSDGRG